MTLLANTFEGGSAGTAVLPGNSGGSSGDAISFINNPGGSLVVYDNTHVAHGSMAVKVTPTSGNAASLRLGTTGLGSSAWAFRFYIWFGTVPSSAMTMWRANDASSAIAVRYNITAAGMGELSTNGTVKYTHTVAFSANTLYRVEAWGAVGASSDLHYGVYLGDSATRITGMTFDTTTAASASNPIDNIAFGKYGGDVYVGPYWLDDIAFDTAATGFLGVPAAAPAPSVSPGSALDALPGTVNLSGTITQSGGTVTSGSWTVISGPNAPTVTNSNSGLGTGTGTFTASFTALAGRYVVQLQGVGTGGATNAVSGRVTVYVAALANADVVPFSGNNDYAVVGTADPIVALTDASNSTYLESLSNPVADPMRLTWNPYNDGAISFKFTLALSAASPVLNVTCNVYKADGTTLIYTQAVTRPGSLAINTTPTECSVDLDPTALALITYAGGNRRALVTQLVAAV